jgi:outer membrane protein TolC
MQPTSRRYEILMAATLALLTGCVAGTRETTRFMKPSAARHPMPQPEQASLHANANADLAASKGIAADDSAPESSAEVAQPSAPAIHSEQPPQTSQTAVTLGELISKADNDCQFATDIVLSDREKAIWSSKQEDLRSEEKLSSLVKSKVIRLEDDSESETICSFSDVETDEFPVQTAGFRIHKNRRNRIPVETIDLGLGQITSRSDSFRSRYLSHYWDRVQYYESDSDVYPDACGIQCEIQSDDTGAPCGLQGWWEDSVTVNARQSAAPLAVDVETILVRALAHSKYLRGLADLPLIRQRSTEETRAAFDVTTFLDSRMNRLDDPIGNDLTVGIGGPPRFRQNDFSTVGGVRRRTDTGALVSMQQQAGLLDNNSNFINPPHQGNARLSLNVTQPLMSGRGKAYNNSLIVLAQVDEKIAWDEVNGKLQDYVVEVTEAYWDLYLQRSRNEQHKRHVQRASEILTELEHRRSIDAVESQIARVRSDVRSRQAELLRSETMVKNVESKLRSLVNDPELYGGSVEVIPSERPHCIPLQLSVQDAMSEALQSRNEIDQALHKVHAASVRLNVAKNELMPVLNMVLDGYLAGLRGNNNMWNAFTDQFSDADPGYTAGVVYEMPYGNRLAKNRYSRRRLEMRQAVSQFQAQVETLMAEVEIAVREVDTAFQELQIRYDAMQAAETDLAYFQRRWELVPSDSRSAVFLLEDILAAQDRLTDSEALFAQSQVGYAVSILRLKRATGILLSTEQISTRAVNDGELGRYQFNKQASAYEVQNQSVNRVQTATPIASEVTNPLSAQPAFIDAVRSQPSTSLSPAIGPDSASDYFSAPDSLQAFPAEGQK